MANETTPSASHLLKSHLNEAVKQYIVYDGTGRMIETYTALTNAIHGAVAEKTTYGYSGATTRVIKMKEEVSTWDSAWDI